MAAALAVTNVQTASPSGELQSVVGSNIVISGTGWALTHAITITIASAEEGERITETVTSDGSGNWTGAAAFTWSPEVDGVWTVTVTDGTSTLVDKIRVFAG